MINLTDTEVSYIRQGIRFIRSLSNSGATIGDTEIATLKNMAAIIRAKVLPPRWREVSGYRIADGVLERKNDDNRWVPLNTRVIDPIRDSDLIIAVAELHNLGHTMGDNE